MLAKKQMQHVQKDACTTRAVSGKADKGIWKQIVTDLSNHLGFFKAFNARNNIFKFVL